MNKHTLEILKKVICYDAVITLLSLIVSIIFFREYAAAVIIGIIIAVVNFLLNAVITNYSMKIAGSAILIVFGALSRVAIAGAFAVILYHGNMLNVAAYLIGYSLHYISIIGATARVHK
ncbi:MAG: ATP synthase subunit I [Bacillota bacterium]